MDVHAHSTAQRVAHPAATRLSSHDGVFGGLNKQQANPAAAKWDMALNHAQAGAKAAPEHGVNIAGESLDRFKRQHQTLNARLGSKSVPITLEQAFAKKAKAASDAKSPEDLKLEKTSQTLVNQFFMGTMLKQMRESPFKSDLFGGGKGGDAYAGLFDNQISEHAGNKLAQSLVKSMVRAYRKQNHATDEGSGLATKAIA